MYVGFAG